MDGATFDAPGVTVHALRDGTYVFDADVFPSVPDALRSVRLAAAGLDRIETAFGAYLLRFDTGRHVLVDAGCGALYGEAGGRLPDELARLGVPPDQIDTLVFTHLHGDHCGGAVADGARVFTGADVVLHAAEHDHWRGTTGPASEVLDRYGGRLRTVAGGEEIAPGLTGWHLPGHTPGHMGLRIGDICVLVGDILHSFALQLPDPDLASIYDHDHDPDRARVSRRAALEDIAARGLVMSGSPGIGTERFCRLARSDGGFEVSTP